MVCGFIYSFALVSGYSRDVVSSRNWWRSRFAACINNPVLLPPAKVFKPKFPQLPVLTDYRVITSGEFWGNFPQNFTEPAVSNISPVELGKCLRENGLMSGEAEKVISWIADGADIGCRGRFRAASQSKNAKNAYEHGRQVSDAIAAWMQQGYAYGPVEEEEELPPQAKINGILTREVFFANEKGGRGGLVETIYRVLTRLKWFLWVWFI
jgi:hypothetical protein